MKGKAAEIRIARQWIASSIEKIQEGIKQIYEWDAIWYSATECELDKIDSSYTSNGIWYFFDKRGNLLSDNEECQKFYLGEIVYVAEYESVMRIGKIVQILKDSYRVVQLDHHADSSIVEKYNVKKVSDDEMEYLDKDAIKQLEDLAKAYRNRKKIKAVVDERRKDLTGICHCFNYQEECPAEYVGTIKEQYWAAERNIVRENFDNLKSMSREWIDEQLLSYFSSWKNDKVMRNFGEKLFEVFPKNS